MAIKRDVNINFGAKDNATKTINKLNRSLKKTEEAAIKIGKGIAAMGAAGTAALIAMARASAKHTQQLEDMAATIGGNVTSFSELAAAAKFANVETTQLLTAMQRMTRRISEAAQGGGEAVDALRELGLEARSLAQLAPEEQFEQISEAMGDVATQGDRVRLAMKLFDSEGVQVVRVMRDMNDARRDARALGAIITPEEAAAVNEMNASMARLSLAMESIGQTINVFLVQQLRNANIELDQWIQTFQDYMVRATLAIGRLRTGWNDFIGDTEEAHRIYNQMKRDVAELQRSFGGGPGGDAAAVARPLMTIPTPPQPEVVHVDLIKDMNDELEKTQKAHENINQTLVDQQRLQQGAASIISSNLADSILKAKSLDDAFKNIGQRIAQMVTEMILFRTIMAGFTGMGFPGFGPMAAGASIGGMRSGLVPVGEAGPELVQLPKGSRIIPNHKLGGAPTVNVSVENYVSEAEVTTDVAPDGTVLVGIVRNIVDDEINGAGRTGTSMRSNYNLRRAPVTR